MSWLNIFKKKDWVYMNEVVPEYLFEYDRDYWKYRLCKSTGTFQRYDIHCLGYHPPEYVSTWITLDSKPKLKKDKQGNWEVVIEN